MNHYLVIFEDEEAMPLDLHADRYVADPVRGMSGYVKFFVDNDCVHVCFGVRAVATLRDPEKGDEPKECASEPDSDNEGTVSYPFTVFSWLPIAGEEHRAGLIFHSEHDVDVYVDGELVRKVRDGEEHTPGNLHITPDGWIRWTFQKSQPSVDDEMEAAADEEAKRARRGTRAYVDSMGKQHTVSLTRLVSWAYWVAQSVDDYEVPGYHNLRRVLDQIDEELKRAQEKEMCAEGAGFSMDVGTAEDEPNFDGTDNQIRITGPRKPGPLLCYLYAWDLTPCKEIWRGVFLKADAGYYPVVVDETANDAQVSFTYQGKQRVYGYYLVRDDEVVGAARFSSPRDFEVPGDTLNVTLDIEAAMAALQVPQRMLA